MFTSKEHNIVTQKRTPTNNTVELVDTSNRYVSLKEGYTPLKRHQ